MRNSLVGILILISVLLFMNTYVGHANEIERGRFYVIGTGPADPQLATLQALETIKRMDAIVASDDHVKLFAAYVGNKPVLFDPWEGLFEYKGKSLRQLTPQKRAEFVKERSRIMEDRVKQIMNLLAEGKNVGLLDNGNPCLFAPCQWYIEQFDSADVVIIPGMGSDAAAMAALGKSVIPAHDTRLVIQTSPFYLFDHMRGDDQMLKDLAKYPATIIQYMALEMPERLFATLGQVYPSDMPCAVVYWAGYPDKQRIIRGTIADMASKLSKEQEKYMGLLLIGRFLEGKPYDGAMNPSKKNVKMKNKNLRYVR